MREKFLREKKIFCAALFALLLVFAVPTGGSGAEITGDAQDPVRDLLSFYVEKFAPETLTLTLAAPPDKTGRFRDLHMDLSGVHIGGVRLDALTFRMQDVQFNAPENWASGDVECIDALQTYAFGHITEKDINDSLKEKTFGKGGDHWKNISMKIRPEGLQGKGNYLAKVLFVTLNILIEVDSGLEVVKNKELWLKDPQVRVNRLDLPDYVTQKALKQIQKLPEELDHLDSNVRN